MKRLLIVCITLLIAITSPLEAKKIDIKLKKEDKAETRSLSIEPTATNEGNNVCIYYSGYILQNIQVTVTDLSGEMIYSNIVSVSLNQPYSFVLNNVEIGEYKIELAYGAKLFYGNFDIEEIF